jgi:GNAT superfamily N-acetyltransferase
VSAVSSPFSPIQKLTPEHELEDFDCGQEQLNRFLKLFALANQRANSAQTYVLARERTVVGFYSLAVGAVEHDNAPPRVGKGLARHPVPVMILARLAVDVREQGKGFGKGLLKDALLRTAQAADIAGIRALLVTAKNEAARSFYLRFDFEPSPIHQNQLFLVMKDILALLK